MVRLRLSILSPDGLRMRHGREQAWFSTAARASVATSTHASPTGAAASTSRLVRSPSSCREGSGPSTIALHKLTTCYDKHAPELPLLHSRATGSAGL